MESALARAGRAIIFRGMVAENESFPLGLLALRRPMASPAVGGARPVRFQIGFSEGGAFLRVVDPAGKPLDADYRAYSGITRDALRAVEQARAVTESEFAWGSTGESAGDDLALRNQSSLVSLLEKTGLLVDEKGQPFQKVAGEFAPRLVLRREEGGSSVFRAFLELKRAGAAAVVLNDPKILADGFLADGHSLFGIEAMGPACESLPLFVERVPAVHFASFLSLFASSFPFVELEVEEYAVSEGEVLAARPALVFHEVDSADTLIFSTHSAVGSLPLEFTRDYDISRLAVVDAEARRIVLRMVDFAGAHAAETGLTKTIRTLERKMRSAETFAVQNGDQWLLSADIARAFLTAELASLATGFALFGTHKLRRYRIAHAKPTLHLRLQHGIQYLEGEGDIEIEGERLSLLDAIAQYRKNSYITLADGTQAVVDAEYMARLERLFHKKKAGLRISFFDLPVLEDLIGEAAATAGFPQAREVFQGVNSIHRRQPRLDGFRGALRPYQVAGVQWLDYLCEHDLGGCLADDMGLGKTVQAIALLTGLQEGNAETTLIVMPRSLLFNWTRELESFAPGLDFTTHYGVSRNWEEAARHRVILTTYGTLRADIEKMAATEFRAVILDESQAIKNPATQTARAAFALRARFRLALSGTPLENHLGELYALFRFLNPGMFPSQADFERHYATPIQKFNDATAAADLRRKIYPFVLRRLKSEVLKELPPKVEQILWVDMTDGQKAFYEERRRYYKRMVATEVAEKGLMAARFAILEAMLELRQIATVPETRVDDGSLVSAKRERILESISEALENGRKCLVFSNFLAGVEQVCEALNEAGIEYERMTGSTANRQERVERFQNDPRVKVFVMTLKTGGVGLNLTAADTVFILDPWWNTSAEAQAVDRAHRIGQSQTVFTYRLIARGTIEEKILELQKRKKDLVDQIVSSDSGAFKALSEADIDHLFEA